jgi:hypothetical protein
VKELALKIGFVPLGGDMWRPVLVFEFDEEGKPLNYQYFLNAKQVTIICNSQKLQMSRRIQVAAARKAEDAEIEDLRI